MARAFTERNLPSAPLWGEVESVERNRILAAPARGDLRCVFSVDVLGEGVDVPSVDTVLLLRPTQSATVLTQQIGRGLRQHRDKSTLTVRHEGERPMQITWELHEPMPESLLEIARLVAA